MAVNSVIRCWPVVGVLSMGGWGGGGARLDPYQNALNTTPGPLRRAPFHTVTVMGPMGRGN
jgi:hypothetical protein